MEQLKAMYPVCTLIKSDGTRCGSPALTGMNFCFHHIGGKIATPKAETRRTNTPLNFIYPGSHEAIQHNLFLVVEALSEGKIDNATAITYNRLFRSAQLNLHRWQKSKLTHGEVEPQMTPCAEPASNAFSSRPEKAERPVFPQSRVGAPHLEEMWEDSSQASSLSDQSQSLSHGCHPERTGVPTDGSWSVGWGSATIGEREVEGPAVCEPATNALSSQPEKAERPAFPQSRVGAPHLEEMWDGVKPCPLSPALKPYLTCDKEHDLKLAQMKKLREEEEARAREKALSVS